MRWSYSASRSFKQCQRQWFFKNIVSGPRAKDALRRRVYLLSKLQSVSAWRGKIVDEVISSSLIPGLNRRQNATLRSVKERARNLFDKQLKFALSHPIDNPQLQPSKEGENFALFYGMEYGPIPTDDDIARAWSDIESALTNLYQMEELRAILKEADYIIAQRALQFELMDGVTVLAYPDAIAFLKGKAPVIIDWKVHAFGQNDSWLQLALYAIALCRSKRHVDFPEYFNHRPEEIKLYEAQLLTNSIREHKISESELEEAEEYMISSAFEITCLTEGKKYDELTASDFHMARQPDSCQRCSFRKICWEKVDAH